MRILIAPDSFKDALRAKQVCERIAAGIRRVVPDAEIDLCPVADGGEGFTDAILSSLDATLQHQATTDPLGRPIEAEWALVQGEPLSAALELASASGLELLRPGERDPMRTTTYGTGLLIRKACDLQCGRILIGLGGSSTNDAGCGLAQALGARFYDPTGQQIKTPITGSRLSDIVTIDTAEVYRIVSSAMIEVACDVNNPLTGPNGAAHVYAPQKGADPAMVEQLDRGLRSIAKLWREQLGVDVEQMPGSGAAGGVGGAMVAMLGAKLVAGAELVLDTVGFDRRLRACDLCITGEGRLDGQSLQGKAAMTVAGRAGRADVPCIALVGSVGDGAERAVNHGLTRYEVIGGGLSAAESIRRTGELLEAAAERAVQAFIRDRG